MSEYNFGDVVNMPLDDGTGTGNLRNKIGILHDWHDRRDLGSLLFVFGKTMKGFRVHDHQIEPFDPALDDPIAIQGLGTLSYQLGILQGKTKAAYDSAQASRRR